MDNTIRIYGGTSQGMDRASLSWKVSLGHAVWVSQEPSPKEVAELIRWFPEMVKLLEEEIKVESKGWASKVVVARNLGQRVSMEVMVHKFQ